MNLISTSKLRRGRRVLEDAEPFFIRIQKIMCDVLTEATNVKSRFLGTKSPKPLDLLQQSEHTVKNAIQGRPVQEAKKSSAILVITSDKGLAGGYNANIIREVGRLSAGLSNPVLILIGNIGYRYFIHSPNTVLENLSFKSRLPGMDDTQKIAELIISQYQCGTFDEVYIVYTHMYSAIKLLPTVMQILPLSEKKLQEDIVNFGWEKRTELRFEYLPTEEEVFDALVPMYIKGIIYGCLIEAYASEQSARMAAMDEASKSAQEMLDSLQLSYNRIRQAGITQEMNEIVGGSAALT
jgi:F-type H+-transporting ATPase subunit gamma